jgi:hypothetical protein
MEYDENIEELICISWYRCNIHELVMGERGKSRIKDFFSLKFDAVFGIIK